MLKSALKIWNKEVFREVEERKMKAMEILAKWHDLDSFRPLNQNEFEEGAAEVENFKNGSLRKLCGDKSLESCG